MFRFQSTLWRVAMVIALAGLVGACNSAPTLNSIPDQQAEVGVELTIEIVASDADGDSLEFRASSPTISDLSSRSMGIETMCRDGRAPFSASTRQASRQLSPAACRVPTGAIRVRMGRQISFSDFDWARTGLPAESAFN